MHAHRPARRDVKSAVGPFGGAPSALTERGSPSGEAHRTQQVSVEHQLGRSHMHGKRSKGTDGELM